jgi:hypothetical protein
MARDIDFDNLTEDDYPYLQARSFLVQEAELQGHEGIREKVDSWKPQEHDYDANQDVRPSPQSQGEAESLGENTVGTTEEEGDSEEEVDYQSATKDELIAELKERNLPTSGTKDELIARLEADDEEEEEV